MFISTLVNLVGYAFFLYILKPITTAIIVKIFKKIFENKKIFFTKLEAGGIKK